MTTKQKRKRRVIPVRFEDNDLTRVAAAAKRKGVGSSTLLRMIALQWLRDNPN